MILCIVNCDWNSLFSYQLSCRICEMNWMVCTFVQYYCHVIQPFIMIYHDIMTKIYLLCCHVMHPFIIIYHDSMTETYLFKQLCCHIIHPFIMINHDMTIMTVQKLKIYIKNKTNWQIKPLELLSSKIFLNQTAFFLLHSLWLMNKSLNLFTIYTSLFHPRGILSNCHSLW